MTITPLAGYKAVRLISKIETLFFVGVFAWWSYVTYGFLGTLGLIAAASVLAVVMYRSEGGVRSQRASRARNGDPEAIAQEIDKSTDEIMIGALISKLLISGSSLPLQLIVAPMTFFLLSFTVRLLCQLSGKSDAEPAEGKAS